MPDEIKTGSIQSLKYVFNMETGNLSCRRNVLRNLTEIFTYNNLDQLTSWQVGATTYSVGYKSDGTSRINTKTDAGTYVYGITPNIHQVTGINNNPGTLNNTNAVITYNSFNKIASIIETGAYRQEFIYAADEQRRVSKLYNSSSVLKKETVYVPGGYEVEKRGTNTRRLHYIPVGDCWALYTKNSSGADSLYFLLTDHLGSVHVITNSSGTLLKEMSFDPWGRRRNPVDWTYNNVPAVSITSRGFTMHEHMDPFKLINMNGRVYDPVLGQFLSPDPYVSNPASTASYNRYAYCNYNPLKYVDPSGYCSTIKGVGHFPGRDSYNGWDYGSGTIFSTPDMYTSVEALWNSTYGGSWSRASGLHFFSESEAAEYTAGVMNMMGLAGPGYEYYAKATAIGGSVNIGDTKYYVIGDGNLYKDPVYSYSFVTRPVQSSPEYSWTNFPEINPSGGGGHDAMDYISTVTGAAGTYFGLMGNMFHNELYWVQKNGTLRSTQILNNSNKIYRTSYNVVKESFATAKAWSNRMSTLGIVVTGIDIAVDGQVRPSHVLNLTLTGLSYTGVGAIAAGLYWGTDIGFEIFTGYSLNERLDQRLAPQHGATGGW